MKQKFLVGALLAVLLISVLFGVWSFGLNQFAGFQAKLHDAQVRSAEAQCVEFGAPHALVADGKAYCYLIYYGSEQIMPLEQLQELFSADQEG